MATSTICSRTFHRKLESRFRNVFVPFEEGPDKAIRPFTLQAGEERDYNLVFADNPHLSALVRFSNDLMDTWAFIEKLFAATIESLAQTIARSIPRHSIWQSGSPSVFCET
jgi:hypothetical protein